MYIPDPLSRSNSFILLLILNPDIPPGIFLFMAEAFKHITEKRADCGDREQLLPGRQAFACLHSCSPAGGTSDRGREGHH